ncbi:MAG: hypothetical protein PGN08_05420 [Sphingomonas taxi]
MMRYMSSIAGSLLLSGVAIAQGSLPPGWVSDTQNFSSVKSKETRTAYVYCPAGKAVTGGGYEVQSVDREIVVTTSAPAISSGKLGWQVTIKNVGAIERSVPVFVTAGCR